MKSTELSLEKDRVMEQLISDLLDEKLDEFDDTIRAIQKESNKKEKEALIEDLKGISTTIEDLLAELPDRAPTIHIVNGKVQ